MFKQIRDKLLDKIIWQPSDEQFADCIEMWLGSNRSRNERLNGSEILNWLRSKERFRKDVTKGAPNIRLIVCERRHSKLSMSISKATFLVLEDVFDLPEVTLHVLSSDEGTCYRSIDKKEHNVTHQLTHHLRLVMKANEKPQIANYGLALSYNFQANTTTAWVLGTHTLHGQEHGGQNLGAQSAQLMSLLQASSHLTRHPLYLPIILLINHFERTSFYVRQNLESNVSAMENALGYTNLTLVGNLPYTEAVRNAKRMEWYNLTFPRLTEMINTVLTDIIRVRRCLGWEKDCETFLSEVLNDADMTELMTAEAKIQTRELKDLLRYYNNRTNGVEQTVSELKERAQTQLNVLYNLIAQRDNRLNARIAADASRDSTAMKSLAVITAVFLPGTAVASLFSMTMFNWQTPAGTTKVSQDFWIYWVVALPLTGAVLLGWRQWWTYEKRRIDRELRNSSRLAQDPANLRIVD